MRDYVILTDSGCDLDKEVRKKYGIDYVKLPIFIDETESFSDLDWEEFSPEQYYAWMREGKKPRSSQINPSVYEEVFLSYLKKDLDVICFALAGALSGSVNSARIARDVVLENNKEAKIIVIDSKISSLGQGFLLIEAANKKAEGFTIDALADYIENERYNYHQVGSVLDLVYLKRAGRISGPAAVMGKIINLKPIVISDVNGANFSSQKVIGRKVSIKTSLDYVARHIINPTEQVVGIVHADCYAEALEIKEALLAKFHVKDVYINWVDPAIGASVGPGMFGIYFKGDRRK
ncbi:MAG: DegV family protein [Acholeplasmatales bacterium]|nr:DegV family protein [Acholeplasmatales bacterium]